MSDILMSVSKLSVVSKTVTHLPGGQATHVGEIFILNACYKHF